MKVLIVRGTSGEEGTELGAHFQKGFDSLGVGTKVVDHEAIVRYSQKTPWVLGLNFFSTRVLGHQVEPINVAKQADKHLLREYSHFRPDLVLFIKGTFVSRSLIRELRRLNKQAVFFNFYPDNILISPRALLASTELDLLFLSDTHVLDRCRRIGIRAERMWEACDPNVYRPLEAIQDQERQEFLCDVSLVGSSYPYRAEMLEPLAEFDLKIWGGFWGYSRKEELLSSLMAQRHRGRHLSSREKNIVYNLSQVNLNPVQPVECITASNQRLHQISSAGAFQLHELAPDLEKQYRVDSEIVTFEDRDDLLDKVRFFLSHPEDAQKIASAARTRMLSEHTFSHRVEEMLGHYWRIRTATSVT